MKTQTGKDLLERFSKFVDRMDWTFAKTYENTAKHRYLVKKKIPNDVDQTEFVEFVRFIKTY